MAAALVDGTPWPCDVARAGQGDRPSSVGEDGRSWGMVVPPGPAWPVRGGPGGGPFNGTSDCSRGGLPARPGVTSEEPTRVRLLGATTEARAPIESGENQSPPHSSSVGGLGGPRLAQSPPGQCGRRGPSQMLGRRFTRRLWPGRVNPTLGCQRQHELRGGAATPPAARQRPSSTSSTGRTAPSQPSGVSPPLEQERRHTAVLVSGHPAVTQARAAAPEPRVRTAKRASVAETRSREQSDSGVRSPLRPDLPMSVHAATPRLLGFAHPESTSRLWRMFSRVGMMSAPPAPTEGAHREAPRSHLRRRRCSRVRVPRESGRRGPTPNC